MKKFIVSDLHGDGEAYKIILNFLENIQEFSDEDIELYINGDLIDRGKQSVEMLFDVKKRIENNANSRIKIYYLAGNHEQLLYQNILSNRPDSLWFFRNGGNVTYAGLQKLSFKKKQELRKFLGDLELFHCFEEKVNKMPILLAHAAAPRFLNSKLRLSDENSVVYDTLWSRLSDKRRLGKDGFFTIVGHTPISEGNGIKYFPNDNSVIIDGGCGVYVNNKIGCVDHFPVVEVRDNSLIFIVLNHSNDVRNCFKFNGEFSRLGDEYYDLYRDLLKPRSDDSNAFKRKKR